MSLSMHAASVPVFVKSLNNMKGWLMKAQAHAESKKFDVNNLVGSRLAVDMLPFSAQILIATSRPLALRSLQAAKPKTSRIRRAAATSTSRVRTIC